MADKHWTGSVKDELGGEDGPKPKKEIKEVRTRKGKSGGYIHEHHHTRPEHHPMEEHTSADQDAMMEHMLQHMGGGDGQGASDAAPVAGSGADASAAAPGATAAAA